MGDRHIMSPSVIAEKGLIYIGERVCRFFKKIVTYRHRNQTTIWTDYAFYCGNTFSYHGNNLLTVWIAFMTVFVLWQYKRKFPASLKCNGLGVRVRDCICSKSKIEKNYIGMGSVYWKYEDFKKYVRGAMELSRACFWLFSMHICLNNHHWLQKNIVYISTCIQSPHNYFLGF